MKTSAKQRTIRFVRHFFTGIVALCTTFCLSACGSDDDNNDKSLNDIAGTYSGTVTLGAATTGETVAVQVQNNKINIASFPVSSLITSIVGEQRAPMMIAAIGTVGYSVDYVPAYNAAGDGIDLTLTTEPLLLNIAAMNTTITVNITAPEKALYEYSGNKLNFVLKVTGVTMGGNPVEDLPPMTFTFKLAK